jgi:hypothetical protein
MATQDVWDQTAYNEEQFYVSYGNYRNPGVTQRVMNYLCFLNSKALFRFVREVRHHPALALAKCGRSVVYRATLCIGEPK